MARYVLFLFSLCLLTDQAWSQVSQAEAILEGLGQVPDEVILAEGQLSLVNIFKRQAEVILSNLGQPEPVIRKAIMQETYQPFAHLWKMYVGDSTTYYEEVMAPMIRDSLSMLLHKTAIFSDAQVDQQFMETARQLEAAGGVSPRGTWYIAFGHAVTDMGGFGQGRMIMDLAHPKVTPEHVQRILPHELNHQVYDHTNREDTTARGLYRCINEGFAVYVNQLLLGDAYALNEYLQYTPEEMAFCLANEDMILAKLKPFLLTSDPDHATALADRGQRIFKDGGPGAIGYFVGYKIVTSYLERQGFDQWTRLYSLPVRDVFAGSAYGTP